MARASVTLKIPASDIEITSDALINSIARAGNTYIQCTSSASSDAETDYTSKVWNLTLPSIVLPKTLIVTTFRIPLQVEVPIPETDGISFAVQVGGSQYNIDSSGNVTDSNFIAYLNSYISQNGAFPPVVFVAGSWILKPSSGSSRVYFQISNPILTGTVEGGSSTIFRPMSDISVGHDILSGFSSVYQLINEVIADDDASYIRSYCTSGTEASPAEEVSNTSVVNVGFSLPEKMNLIQLRPVVRSLDTGGGPSAVTITVSADGVSSSFKVTAFDSFDNYRFIDKNAYNTFEGVFDPSSPIIEAINSYYKKHNTAPLVETTISTSAKASNDSGYKSGTDAEIRVTQVYLEAVYGKRAGMNLYCKEGSTWKQALTAYEKGSGAWIEITEDECKEILQSNLLSSENT